ncbi:DUF4349 domain-containing protein [Chloroflexota bacterium]
MKRLIVIIGLLSVVFLLLASCAAAPPTPMPTPTPTPAPMPTIREEGYKESGAGALPSIAEERMIVRNGDVSLVVEDVLDARDEIAQLAARLGGYVVSSWISGEEQEMRGSITIRVPDEKFEQAFGELRDLAVRVRSENTSSQDVTEEYTDLGARLKNSEATESQYLALLDKAESVEDTVKIYDGLSQVRREIEQIKGRMQYLERTTSMSLVTAQLRPAATAKPLIPVGWSASEAFKSAIRGVITLGQWLVTLVIWLVFLFPIWGTVVGIIYWRHRRRKKAQ